MKRAFPLILAVLVAFGPTLLHEFVYDDLAIQSRELWQPPYTRPLTLLTFTIDRAAGPAVGHAMNIALHLANVMLISCILPLPAAAIFAVHPLQVEPVSYIWARSTLLMTLFCLLAMRVRGWRAVGWFALALLSKEECVAFPLVLLFLGERRKIVGATLALSAVAGGYTFWAASTLTGSQAGAQSVYTPIQYLSAQGFAILRYLGLFVAPVGPFTVEPQIPLGQWWAWAVVIALALAALKWRHAIWLTAAIVLLLPSSSIFPANDLAAERRMYLPMVALAAFVGLHIRSTYAVLGVLTVLSVFQVRHWQNERTLWTHVVNHNAGSVRARLHLARQTNDLTLLPEVDDARVSAERGRIYITLERYPEALREFGRALALDPRNSTAMANRGLALLLLGQADAARSDFERALRTNPCTTEARHNLQQMGFDPGPLPARCR